MKKKKSVIYDLKSNILQNKMHYFLLFVLLSAAYFVRAYRTNDLLRFFYDQGRDAVVIHEMITTPKPVLVGPTTGLAGILRGPAFYYLLLPAYFFSGGSPIFAAIWLQLINFVGLFFFYLLARKLFSPAAGLIAVFLLGFSNYLVDLSRWLSNPSPIFTSVPVMLYGLHEIKNNRSRHLWWPIVALMVGLNLQFEIASEFWFIPALVLLMLISSDFRPSLKTFSISLAIFLATLAPQVLFDIRHDGIMRQGIADHFASSTESSFIFSMDQINDRLDFYLDVAHTIFSPGVTSITLVFLSVFAVFFVTKRDFRLRSWWLLFLIGVPLTVLLFFAGNQGNFYSYYLIGLFPILVLLIAGGLAQLNKGYLVPLLVIGLLLFAKPNFKLLYYFLIAGTDGPEHISLEPQLQAIDWIYQDAAGQPFNVDVYVPPVIPYAYDYLFLWYGQKEHGYQPTEEQNPLLYTLYEVDPPHPERLQAWLDRQAGIGEVKKQESYGGIHVQRRTRY